MSTKFDLFHLYAETSVHAGTGSDIGIVDLPIQRERHTEYPVIWSSSLKGSIRNFVKDSKKDTDEIFGPWKVEENKDARAGKIAVSDAKILAFPVRSTKTPFVWITSPTVLNKYMRMASLANKDIAVPLLGNNNSDEALVTSNEILENGKIFLEEFGLKASLSDGLKLVADVISDYAFPKEQAYNYIRNMMKNNLVVVEDSVFTFMTKSFTEVNPRIRIDIETGTVQEGALWYEENLPEDTVMYFTLSYSSNEKDVEDISKFLDGKRFTVGGNKTIGKGVISVRRYQ